MEAAQTYESMCRLGGAEGALVQPDTIKIATISGISPLNEAITATTTAVDEKARQMITELSEALKIMGRSIDKNENDNKQLRKEIKIDHGNKNLNFSNYGSAVVMCSHCNELGHTEDKCQTHTAYDWNNIQGNGNYEFTKRTKIAARGHSPPPIYNQQYLPYQSEMNYENSPPYYQDQQYYWDHQQNCQYKQNDYLYNSPDEGSWNPGQRWKSRGGYRQGRGQEGNRGNWERNSRRQNGYGGLT